MLERARFAMALPAPNVRDVESLQSWIRGTGFNREETAYLDHNPDLISLGETSDVASKAIESMIVRHAARSTYPAELNELSDSIEKVPLLQHVLHYGHRLLFTEWTFPVTLLSVQ